MAHILERDYFLAGLDRIGLKHNVPQGTYFVMVDISEFLSLPRFQGRSDLEFLRECAKLRFTESHYIANRNRRFDINIFALTTFNLCEFFPDEPERNLVLLDDSIKMLDRYECSCEQSDLLLYKARFLYDLGEMNGARNCFNAGYYLIVCRYSRKEADERAMEILEERFESLKKTT